MNFRELNGKSIADAFDEFDRQNPRVYEAFKQQVIKAARKKIKRVSSKAIINWLRWEMFLVTNDQNFKINDAFTPYFSRKFIKEYPGSEEMFEFRKLRTEEPGPYMTVDDNHIEFVKPNEGA